MKIVPNPRVLEHKRGVHGGLYSINTHNQKITDYSSNINPFGCHPLVKKSLKKQMNVVSIYPDSDSTIVRKYLKSYTGIPENQIVIGNGATEIIYNFCHAFLNKKTPVLIPIPTFSEYEIACKLYNCKISFFNTFNLNEDLENFIKKIPNYGCIFICNPNNPTGMIINKNKMRKLIQVSQKKSTLVFVDECFIELSDPKQSLMEDLKRFDNLFILRSLTKSFGLAGVRIGYGLGNKKLTTILNNLKIPWNVNGIAQKAACAALCNHTYLKKARNLIMKEKKFLKSSISKIDGFFCFSTDTNFILIKTKKKSNLIQQKLLKKKILVRDCSSFRGLTNHYIRVSVKTHKENLKLIKALGEI